MDNLAQILHIKFLQKQPGFEPITGYFSNEIKRRKAGEESIFDEMDLKDAKVMAYDVVTEYAIFLESLLEGKRIRATNQTTAWYEMALFNYRYIQVEKGTLDIENLSGVQITRMEGKKVNLNFWQSFLKRIK
ncbi:MAG: hypothetical protein IH795_00755 [Bacteroidetes bacterium]|nr:hypothetical protein [Bacteroidota bacterium]